MGARYRALAGARAHSSAAPIANREPQKSTGGGTDEERRAIYQALKSQPAAAFNADVGTELPPGVELHPVPNEVAARVPQTRGYRYVVAKDRVLLVGTSRIVVGIFADANAC